jgi:hypothetical protein
VKSFRPFNCKFIKLLIGNCESVSFFQCKPRHNRNCCLQETASGDSEHQKLFFRDRVYLDKGIRYIETWRHPQKNFFWENKFQKFHGN